MPVVLLSSPSLPFRALPLPLPLPCAPPAVIAPACRVANPEGQLRRPEREREGCSQSLSTCEHPLAPTDPIALTPTPLLSARLPVTALVPPPPSSPRPPPSHPPQITSCRQARGSCKPNWGGPQLAMLTSGRASCRAVRPAGDVAGSDRWRRRREGEGRKSRRELSEMLAPDRWR